MTNDDFARIVDTSDEWIVTRTGIKERRIADNTIAGSDMAVAACRNAIAMANIPVEEIDLLVIGTVTPDYRLPSNACIVQEKLGLKNAFAFDIAAACTGFISGLSLGKSYIESGTYKNVLVVGCEKLSSIVNYTDRSTCVLFGDAAGAVVLSASPNGSGILSTFVKSDGGYRELLWINRGGTINPYDATFNEDGSDKLIMNGSEIFKIAVREMERASVKVIEDAGISPSQVSLLIPHQANIRIIEAIAKRLNLSMDKIYLNIHKYGNTSAASIPLALDEANREGLIRDGDYILMTAFGAGLTWGSALVRW